MSLGYNSNLEQKLSYIKEMEDSALYRPKSGNGNGDDGGSGDGKGSERLAIESVELGGYDGFTIGALYAAHCSGDRDPETWQVFLKMEITNEDRT
jgi:hypothetical protein